MPTCKKCALQHHLDHASAIRAQRHAHANLAGALLDVVRRHAVEADGREHQSQPAEQQREVGDHALLREVGRHSTVLYESTLYITRLGSTSPSACFTFACSSGGFPGAHNTML